MVRTGKALNTRSRSRHRVVISEANGSGFGVQGEAAAAESQYSIALGTSCVATVSTFPMRARRRTRFNASIEGLGRSVRGAEVGAVSLIHFRGGLRVCTGALIATCVQVCSGMSNKLQGIHGAIWNTRGGRPRHRLANSVCQQLATEVI